NKLVESNDRVEKLFKGEEIDRVPVIPHMEAFAGKICNMGTKEFYMNPKSAYEAQVWCEELFSYDGGIGYDIPYGYTQEFGGEIKFLEEPKLSYPKIISRPVNTKDDVEKLILPDVRNSFYGSKVLGFNRRCYENNKGVSISAGSPMNIAQCIVEVGTLMRWIRKEPNLVHQIMRISTDYIISLAQEHVREFGARNVSAGMSCPMECHSMMSPKTFEKFSLPYIKEIYDKFSDMGISIDSVHLCGDHKKNLGYWKNDIILKERTLITVGTEFDLSKLGEELGEKYIIGGNLKNITLQTGSPRDVYNEARGLIEEMKYFKGGYILTPDCTLSYLTPSANLYAMIKASRDFGVY
ncbi:MAG: uroporphyrinogen decarboxylase family protein, partial [Clostridium sp.]